MEFSILPNSFISGVEYKLNSEEKIILIIFSAEITIILFCIFYIKYVVFFLVFFYKCVA